MAKVELALGAEIDIATGQELEDSEGRLSDLIKGRRSWPAGVLRKNGVGAGIASATIPTVIWMDEGPARGQIWDVHLVAVTTDTPWVAQLAVPVAMYASAQVNRLPNPVAAAAAGANIPPKGDFIDASQNIPATFVFGKEQLTLTFGERLGFVAILGAGFPAPGVAGNQIIINVRGKIISAESLEHDTY